MASGLLPKSPVSSSLCDEVPHIFIQKSHLEPREFLISSAKRLLQHNRHKASIRCVAKIGRYWDNSGQQSILALNGLVAYDPTDGVIGRPSLWIAEDFGCCASG
jgi:hypothetical protein